MTFGSIGHRKDVLIAVSDRTPVDCPQQNDRTGVIVSFGQSNAANMAQHRFSPEEVPDVINWYDRKCYPAQSPLLGATGSRGEWISIASQKLVENGTFDKVVILSLGVGASPVAAWGSEGDLNKRLMENLAEISRIYSITDLIWHQGEADLSWGVGRSQYFETFRRISEGIREIVPEAPILMSIASYCKSGDYLNNITDAQFELVNLIDGIELGVNTDLLVPPSMRPDGCHFELEGQLAVATHIADTIARYHR